MKECTCAKDAIEIEGENERVVIVRCPACEEKLQRMIEEGAEVQRLAIEALRDRGILERR